MPDPLGPVQINAAGSGVISLPQGITHIDYKGLILWNTSGYIITINPKYNESGSFTIPPSNSLSLNADWDLEIPYTATAPTSEITPVDGVIAGSIYYNNEALPPAPTVNPTQVAAEVTNANITVSGIVEVGSGVIDVQPVAAGNLGTETGPGVLTVTPSNKAVGLYIHAPGDANVVVQGTVTNTNYNVVVSSQAGFNGQSLFTTQIDTAQDPSYTVSVTDITAGQAWQVSENYSGVTAINSPVPDGGTVWTYLIEWTASPSTAFSVSLPVNATSVIIGSEGGLIDPPSCKIVEAGGLTHAVPVRVIDYDPVTNVAWWAVMVYAPSGYQTMLDINFNSAQTVEVLSASKEVRFPNKKILSKVAVPQPPAGNDWYYTIPFNARLIGFEATLVASATAGTRYPKFYRKNIYDSRWFSMTPNGVAASTSAFIFGTPAPNINNPIQQVGGSNTYLFNFPDANVPIGTGFGTVQTTLAGDQWESISLTFEVL